MTADTTAHARARSSLNVPILRFLDARPLDEEDLTRGLSLTVSPKALNAVGGVHAGVLASVLEVVAYLAITRDLADDEDAITHAFFASYIGPAGPGAHLEATARVIRRGKAIAFVEAEIRNGEQLVATASVTKSIRPVAQG